LGAEKGELEKDEEGESEFQVGAPEAFFHFGEIKNNRPCEQQACGWEY